VHAPETFTVIFLVDAASSLIPMALLLGPLRHVRTQSQPADDEPAGGYREILRRPAVLWLTLLTFIAVFIGYGQMEAGFPAYAREVAEVSTQTIGFAFAVNTAVIVLLQFTVLTRIKGRRRTRVMMVMAAVWAVSWLILGAAGLLPDTVTAAIGVLAFMGVFAFGETLLQPTVPAVYNDLASDHNRGRYNAINSGAFQGGAITGPIAAGLLLANDLDAVYIAVMVIGCVGIGVLALALERRLPASANGTPTEPAVSTPRTEPH
jgi:MFS family permease